MDTLRITNFELKNLEQSFESSNLRRLEGVWEHFLKLRRI